MATLLLVILGILTLVVLTLTLVVALSNWTDTVPPLYTDDELKASKKATEEK